MPNGIIDVLVALAILGFTAWTYRLIKKEFLQMHRVKTFLIAGIISGIGLSIMLLTGLTNVIELIELYISMIMFCPTCMAIA